MSLVKKLRNVALAGLTALVIGCGDDWSKVPVANAGPDQPANFDKTCFDNKLYNEYGECKSGYSIKDNIHSGNKVTLDGSTSRNEQAENASSGGLEYKWRQISGSSAVLSSNGYVIKPEVSSNGVVKPEFTPSITGDYVFGLIVNNEDYKSPEDTVTVYVRNNLPPVADFDYYIWSCSPQCNVRFPVRCGNTDLDIGGKIVKYEWNFGDGKTRLVDWDDAYSYYCYESNTYANNGTYNVSLTVTDDDGATSKITKQITVQ